jgi:hypothetical protein
VIGAEVFTIAAADTVMKQTNRELLAHAFPRVEIRGELGAFDTLMAIGKAGRILGYAPRYTWRK